MSDEIDLQLYARAIRRRWWIVVIFVAVALVIAFAISAIQSNSYEATATLSATGPRFTWRFEGGIQSIVNARQDYQRQYLALWDSNDIVLRATQMLTSSGQLPEATLSSVLTEVSVRSGDDNTLLVTGTGSDPQQAADLANAYAQAFVDVTRELLGVSSDLADYRSELKLSAQKFNQAEKILTEARGTTGFLLVSGTDPNSMELTNLHMRQLDLKSTRLAEYLNDLEGVRSLISQLESAQPDADLSLLPWELLSGPVLRERGTLSPSSALTALNDPQKLLAMLRNEETALATAADQLTKESEDLQRQVADDWVIYSTATRNYGQARDTYLLLARKVSEAEIQERIDPGQLTVVSTAIPPEKPVTGRQVALYAVAGMIGLILGVIVALWSGLRDTKTHQPKQPALV